MRGTLEHFSLVELLQALSAQGFRGQLRATAAASDGDESTAITLDGTRVRGARFGALSGLPALLRLLGYRGAFETVDAALLSSDVDTIAHLTVEQLVAAVRADPQLPETILRRVPSLDVVPLPNLQIVNTVYRPLGPQHWRVVFALDGARSLRQLGQETRLDDLTVCRIVCELQNLRICADRWGGTTRAAAEPVRDVPAPPRDVDALLERVVLGTRKRSVSIFKRPTDADAGMVLKLVNGEHSLGTIRRTSGLGLGQLLLAVQHLLDQHYITALAGADALEALTVGAPPSRERV